MSAFPLQKRTMALIAVIVPLLVVLVYVAMRSGPLAPIAVTETEVETRTIQPALFGIGTVEARHTYKIGPIVAGRLKSLEVQVGDYVTANQVLGEMDSVDMDDRIRSSAAAVSHTEATLREAVARRAFAETQANRYEQLFVARSVSEEALLTKRQELAVATAVFDGAKEELNRIRADRDALMTQRDNLRLIAPVNGLVTLRNVDPGTTVVAGQAAVELIDPESLWVNVRFDQISANGLSAGLPANIILRSNKDLPLKGKVERMELKADAVTEEIIAKVTFDKTPSVLPPIGELAEVTVDLPELAATTVIPNAAIQRQGNQLGVWQILAGKPYFKAVKLGRSDLDGRVQVLEGLNDGDRVVVYTEKALSQRSRVHVVAQLPGVAK